MRKRVDQLGVGEPEIQRSGKRPDLRRPPGRQERRARAAPGRHARPAVLLRLGDERPRARRQAVAASAANGDSPSGSARPRPTRAGPPLYDAVKLAAKRPPIRDGNNFASAPQYYLFAKAHAPAPRRARGHAGGSAVDATDAPARAAATRCSRSRRARSCCRPSTATRRRAEPPGPALLRPARQPGAARQGHQGPEQQFNSGPGGNSRRSSSSNSPARARRRSRRSRARSPSAARTPSCRATTPTRSLQHFAVALDGKLISVASIDPQQFPDGHRRRERRGDRGRLHDPERPGPREPDQARRAADRAEADLAVPGLGHARQAGAAPGPDRGRSSGSRRRCSS